MLNKWTCFHWVFRNMPGIIQNNLIHAMKFDQTLVCTCISWCLLKMQIVFRLVTGSEILHFYQAVSWWLSDRCHTYSSKDQILILTHCIDAFPSPLFFFFFFKRRNWVFWIFSNLFKVTELMSKGLITQKISYHVSEF